ncbi:uncharacterized protein LOC124362060 [Homalodisca vitripennis]|uniref:uncharacterized protein LOC124362060 n=1 Tax=Homalodisca vitripennis TaxID=197043 RepID=UPI001EEC5542|nr:uncharacterized protein LOC124362060 [Homalodisca vitripennis]KAG8332835.1 F-box only protein 43 [Homalodisca vitripennis]
MESKSNKSTPAMDPGLWASPDLFACHSRRRRELTSTPHLSSWTLLENSAGSSKQDSGYCSQTPGSGESSRALCCSHSTPQCSCQPNKFYGSQSSPRLDFLQSTSESRTSSARQFPTRISRPFDFYDETMDTSLYPDDMEVEENESTEGNQFALSLSEIGEEKSIDFVENGVCLSSTTPENIDRSREVQTDNTAHESGFESEDFFSPETEVLGFNTVSSKVKVGDTPRKNDCNFRNVTKKITTLNWIVKSFSMNGVDRLDFLYQLGVKRHFPHIVSKILSFLSEKDLDSVHNVSKTWREIMVKDTPAHNRWTLYSATMQLRRENLTSPTKLGSSRRPAPFSPLHNLNNQINVLGRNSNGNRRSPRHSPTVSPESARFRSFQRAARSLKQGERLLHCPRCHFPSHDHGSPTIMCSRSGCRHRFCVWCRNEVVTGKRHDCPPLYTPQLRRTAHKLPPIGSKSCKRNLRRL